MTPFRPLPAIPDGIVVGGITELLGWEWSGPDIDYWSPTGVLIVVVLNVVSIGLSIGLGWVVVKRLPPDYFASDAAHPRSVVERIAGNLAGVVTALLGLILLATPGQGAFLILIGVIMTDLPGKRRLERWLAGRKRVLRALNAIRRKAGQDEFAPPSGSPR